MHTVVVGLVLADVQKSIGYVIAAVLIVGFIVAVAVNMRSGRKEVGAEITLAANRKPYLDDDELETKRLDRTLAFALLLLAVVAVALPLYWLAEPGRQDDAVNKFNDTFIAQGEELYVEGAQCAACHGPEGSGGAATFALTAANGDFIESVNWQAPALNTVLYRYSRDEVKFIITYGRGFSPMAAWGADGGGPLTNQQIDNIIDYLQSVQLEPADARAAVEKELDTTCGPDADGNCQLEGAEFATLGEALFNMGMESGFAGGAYSCGRCHTQGWSYGDPQGPGSGSGAMGPALDGGRTLRQFPTAESQIDFVTTGSDKGKTYGVAGLSGAGMMPGFGENPNVNPALTSGPKVFPMSPDQVMLTPEQIAAVVEYERSL